MDIKKRLLDALDRRLTLMVIPQASLRPWRWQCSAGFFVFALLMWSGMTVWAGFIVGRQADYAITKADNKVMLAKMTRLAQQMERASEVLDQARATDRQLRGLLSMSRGSDPIEAATGVGGPTLAERLSLSNMISASPQAVRQADWHKEIERLRAESERRLASFSEIAWYVGNQKSLRNATPALWPTEGSITSLYGYRFSPMGRSAGETGEFHAGIDIANSADTLIRSTADGTVRFSGWSHGYGNMVIVDHGYGVSTLYGHTSKALVRAGERVVRGQVIAYMGTTGRSTGAHLHYEVWRQGRPVNPMSFLKVRTGPDLLGFAAPRRRGTT